MAPPKVKRLSDRNFYGMPGTEVGTPGEERSHRSGARLFAVRTGKQVGPGERSELSATLHISRGIVQRQEVHFAGAATLQDLVVTERHSLPNGLF